MKDVLCFSAPLPLVGWILERVLLENHLREFLQRRNAVLKEVAESPARSAKYLPRAFRPGD